MLVRLAACGVCHTDLYTASGADPTGYAPCVLGHEGAGVVERVGEGVTLVQPGDHVITLFAPECGRCVHCLSPRTNRCIAIREQQGLGYLPDGTTRLSRDGEPLRHFMGTSTFAEYTVMPEIALAKVSPDAPARRLRPVRLRALDRHRRRALHGARSSRGSTCVVFGCGLVGLGAVIGARLAGAERIIAIDLSEERLARGAPSRRHRHAGRRRRHGRLDPRGDRRLRRRLHLRGDGQRRRDAAGRRGGARGVGPRDDVRRRRQGRAARGRAALPDHRPPGDRLSFGGVKGRTQVPLLVDRWLAGEIDVEALLSHRLTLDDVNRGFELMEAQDGIRSVLRF